MKVAFFALASFTRILSTEAITSGSVALTYAPNQVDYVTGSTPTTIDITIKVTSELKGSRSDHFTITSAPSSLFSADGAVDVTSAIQANNANIDKAKLGCVAANAAKTIKCTLTGTTTQVNANVDLVVKLAKKGSVAINVLPAAATSFTFQGVTSRDVTVGTLTGFTVQKAQVKSAQVTLPPKSHVVGTTPTAFEFVMQPRTPLVGAASSSPTITITSTVALFTGTGSFQTSKIAQPTVSPLPTATQFTCTPTSTTVLKCSLTASKIITTQNLSVTLINSATAKLTALPTAAGTKVQFTYATSVDATPLGPQLAFETQVAQIASAAVTLTPSTYYTQTTPTAIKFTIQLRQPLSASQTIVITSNLALWTGAGPLTVKSVNNTGGAVTTTSITAAADATGKITTISLGTGASIVNSAPFEILLEAGTVAKFAALGAALTQTTFSIGTSLTKQGLALQGWTVVAAPKETSGTTFLPAAVSKGATCFSIYNSKGFVTGGLVQIGKYTGLPSDSEQKYVQAIYSSTDCTGTALTSSRRLASTLASIKPDTALINSYAADSPVAVVTPSYGSTCFPGGATVDVYGRGATHMASLSVGDRVLVENGEFEPVLSFLHKVPGDAIASTVVHSQGTFQASENHIVFTSRGDMPVSALRPGDELLVQSGPSTILAIGQEITGTGMYAPFTASGALVVDGVVASNYGTPTSKSSLPHAAAHAAFFSLRVYYYLDLAIVAKVLCSLVVVMMLPHMRSHKL